MLYRVVRLVLTATVALPLWAAAKKLNKKDKKWPKICVVLFAAALFVILHRIPVENRFVTFPSAQAVYEYAVDGTVQNSYAAEGESCTLLVTSQGGSHALFFVPKTEDGWKIDRQLGRTVGQYVIDGGADAQISVDVLTYKDTGDYFIWIYTGSEETLTIENSSETQAVSIEEQLNTESAAGRTYLIYEHSPDTQYCLEINGESIFPFENI